MTAELEHLRSVTEADVYKAGRPAATLRRAQLGVTFAYEPSYDGPPVATTLPLGGEPVIAPAGAVPPFFAGLLPEGRRLTAVRRAVKTSADDELSILLAVGADTIGDVQVVPRGTTPDEAASRVVADRFEDVRFRDLIEGIDRVALPGVQEKVSSRMLAVPVARRDARYILKLEVPEFPHVVENEAFFLKAAQTSGLACAEAEMVRDATGERGLLVRRFDRPRTAGGVAVLAQEDACQVLGRYPADKYNVTAEEAVAALVRVTRAQPVAARELLRQLAFAYLTCNGDAHAKNLSVIHDGEWRVTPAYDVPSSHPYDDHTMALSIAGLFREDITRDTFVAFGETIGLRPRATQKALDELCERAGLWLPRLDELPFGQRRIHKLRRAIAYRRDRLR